MSSGSGERAPGRTKRLALYLRLSSDSDGGECHGNFDFFMDRCPRSRPLPEGSVRAIIGTVAAKLHSYKVLLESFSGRALFVSSFQIFDVFLTVD